MSKLNVQFDLPLGVHAPAATRRALTGVLTGWGFYDLDWLDSAALVLTELVANAVMHGHGCVEFSVQMHEQFVTLSVVDESPVVPRRRIPDESGGYGLAIIEALTSAWGIHDHQGGKRVWAQLPPAPRVPAE